jgi:hypothetical protein
VPTILLGKDEALQARQWREQYLDGFYVLAYLTLSIDRLTKSDLPAVVHHQRRLVGIFGVSRYVSAVQPVTIRFDIDDGLIQCFSALTFEQVLS